MMSNNEKGERSGRGVGGVSYRTGVAARLAGLSAETLRVWERRYNVSGAERSASGQRLYSVEQVRRLGLLKQLVDQGHAIGVLVGLSMLQLQELSEAAASEVKVNGPIQVVAVGVSLGARLAVSAQAGVDISVLQSCPYLDQVKPVSAEGVEVLLVELSEPDDRVLPLIQSARERCGARAVVVLYRFCASATIRALRAQGCLAARVPPEIGELIHLCRSALAGQRLPAVPEPQVPQVRFDEESLARITAMGNRLACECPRHLSDLLLMVGSFERYSAVCASRDAADAQLHKELGLAAGKARAILEVAMERLVRSEGMWPLPELKVG